MTVIIAIDGPAASGKGTLARRLARHFDYACLDTGALYRAVALMVLRAGGDVKNEQEALKAARKLSQNDLNDPAIKNESTGEAASIIAALPAVRDALLDFQRDFAHKPPGNKAGAILDGRDIGTVVCPDADIKLFITATAETRAKRRFLEQFGTTGSAGDFANILDQITRRDQRDSSRDVAPLKAAANACLLDTTNSDIEAVFETALALISNNLRTS
ncbi:MAG: (d)CMP kinase [Alphaproteobacteria bacterium]|nr:(d)CMP kinase [Alphaproteobacteria bacterium]